jgi:hypothetical protein
MAKQYAFSTDEERYTGGFGSLEAACAEAAAVVGVDGRFWAGEAVPPPQPETVWRADRWLEEAGEQDAYCGDWAVDWDRSTKEQRAELEREVRAVMAAWLDRHGLRPRFFNVEHPQEFHVTDETDGVFTVEPEPATA